VRGSNQDGLWATQEKSLSLIILPAPWRTWWAYLSYFLVVFTIVWFVWRQREQKLVVCAQAAAKVHASEERLSLALWGSGEQLLDWNVERNLIYRRNILVGFDFLELEEVSSAEAFSSLIHPDDRSQVVQSLQLHLQGVSANFESAHRLKNTRGEWIWVIEKGRVTARDANDQVLRMSGVLSNEHELYDTQAQLKALNEDLEQAVIRRTAQ
jgi:PAS domain-containing protein